MNKISLSERIESIKHIGISDNAYVLSVLQTFAATPIDLESSKNQETTFGMLARKLAHCYYKDPSKQEYIIFCLKKYLRHIDGLSVNISASSSAQRPPRKRIKRAYRTIYDFITLPAEEYINTVSQFEKSYNRSQLKNIATLTEDFAEDATSTITLGKVYVSILRRYLGIASLSETEKYNQSDYATTFRCMRPLIEYFVLPIAEVSLSARANNKGLSITRNAERKSR